MGSEFLVYVLAGAIAYCVGQMGLWFIQLALGYVSQFKIVSTAATAQPPPEEQRGRGRGRSRSPIDRRRGRSRSARRRY